MGHFCSTCNIEPPVAQLSRNSRRCVPNAPVQLPFHHFEAIKFSCSSYKMDELLYILCKSRGVFLQVSSQECRFARAK